MATNLTPKTESRNLLQPGLDKILYFDAISDNGRDAIIVTLSPAGEYDAGRSEDDEPPKYKLHLTVLIDGRLSVDTACKVDLLPEGSAGKPGTCVLELAAASYGFGYLLKFRLPARGGGEIFAEMEWLFVGPPQRQESLIHELPGREIIATRADVSGRFSMRMRRREGGRIIHFRGTGYHDRRQISAIGSNKRVFRFWARSHFADSTVIFDSEFENKTHPGGRLMVIDEEGWPNSSVNVVSRISFPKFNFSRHFSLTANTESGLFFGIDANKTLLWSPVRRVYLGNCRLITAQKSHVGFTLCELLRPPGCLSLLYRLNKYNDGVEF